MPGIALGSELCLGREQPKFFRQSLDGMKPAIIEIEAGTCHQVLYCARYKDLSSFGRVRNARGDMHGYPANIVAQKLYFAGMDAGAKFEAKGTHSFG